MRHIPDENRRRPAERTYPRGGPGRTSAIGAGWNGNWIFDCGHPENIAGSAGRTTTKSEIHPPRAIAAMRQQVHTLPGTGNDAGPGDGDRSLHPRSAGFVDVTTLSADREIIVGLRLLCGESGYPHRGTPIDADYDFDILPAGPKPVPERGAGHEIENRSRQHARDDPVLTPQPSAGPCADPAYSPTRSTCRCRSRGTGATPDDVCAGRSTRAGSIRPNVHHLKLTLDKMILHDDYDTDPGDCECSFFWMNVDKASRSSSGSVSPRSQRAT